MSFYQTDNAFNSSLSKTSYKLKVVESKELLRLLQSRLSNYVLFAINVYSKIVCTLTLFILLAMELFRVYVFY